MHGTGPAFSYCVQVVAQCTKSSVRLLLGICIVRAVEAAVPLGLKLRFDVLEYSSDTYSKDVLISNVD